MLSYNSIKLDTVVIVKIRLRLDMIQWPVKRLMAWKSQVWVLLKYFC